MEKAKARVKLGTLVVLFVFLTSASEIMGMPNGAGDGDKLPSACVSCHASPGSGTVTITASKNSVNAGESLELTVSVFEPTLTGNGIIGVFLLKAPVGSGESVTKDGWTISKDPNGNKANYAEKSGLTQSVQATFVWVLNAPAAAGTYSIYAVAEHGGSGAASENSPPVSITISQNEEKTVGAPPVIGELAFQSKAETGSLTKVSVRITDDKEGVQCACLCYKTPGCSNYTQSTMVLTEGTRLDGVWTVDVDVGLAPGTVEFNLSATDGKQETRSPTSGSFFITVLAPSPLKIVAPMLPEKADYMSTINVSTTISDNVASVKLAVLRYKMPGETDFCTKELKLGTGTDKDGSWGAQIGTGPEAGTMELYIEATDGINDICSPASGSYYVKIVKPPGPVFSVNATDIVCVGNSPDITARASDPLGVAGVRVFYKRSEETSYSVAVMSRRSGDDRDGEWAVSLPAGNATGEYGYFVVAHNSKSENKSESKVINIMPDMNVSGITFSKKAALVKGEVVISAVIENRADRAYTDVMVTFMDMSYTVGDQRFIRSVIVTVPANGNVTASVKWVPQINGARQIAVVVDADKKVAEGNEENNQMTSTIPVGLESGMGVRFPIPRLQDIWVQLTVVLYIVALVGGVIIQGLRKKAARKAALGRKGNGRRPGNRKEGRR